MLGERPVAADDLDVGARRDLADEPSEAEGLEVELARIVGEVGEDLEVVAAGPEVEGELGALEEVHEKPELPDLGEALRLEAIGEGRLPLRPGRDLERRPGLRIEPRDLAADALRNGRALHEVEAVDVRLRGRLAGALVGVEGRRVGEVDVVQGRELELEVGRADRVPGLGELGLRERGPDWDHDRRDRVERLADADVKFEAGRIDGRDLERVLGEVVVVNHRQAADPEVGVRGVDLDRRVVDRQRRLERLLLEPDRDAEDAALGVEELGVDRVAGPVVIGPDRELEDLARSLADVDPLLGPVVDLEDVGLELEPLLDRRLGPELEDRDPVAGDCDRDDVWRIEVDVEVERPGDRRRAGGRDLDVEEEVLERSENPRQRREVRRRDAGADVVDEGLPGSVLGPEVVEDLDLADLGREHVAEGELARDDVPLLEPVAGLVRTEEAGPVLVRGELGVRELDDAANMRAVGVRLDRVRRVVIDAEGGDKTLDPLPGNQGRRGADRIERRRRIRRADRRGEGEARRDRLADIRIRERSSRSGAPL